jgi:hypothetical protein
MQAYDTQATVPDEQLFAEVKRLRAAYLRALRELQSAHELLDDLKPGNADGRFSLRQGTEKFNKTREEFQQASDALLKRLNENNQE